MSKSATVTVKQAESKRGSNPVLRGRLKACARCRGDAYLDSTDFPEWRCIQCGRSVLHAADAPSLGSGSHWSNKASAN